MLNKNLFVLIFAVMLSGCASLQNMFDPVVPEDFIIEQNTTAVRAALNNIEGSDYVVRFARGSSDISADELQAMLTWFEQTQPEMVTVRGAAGAEKYRDLGIKRTQALVTAILNNNIPVQLLQLEYDAQLPGGRAYIQVVSDALANRVRQEAPILIIRSK